MDIAPADPCPCGSGERFDACCGPIISGVVDAPTAERLMRSRYTAFALGRRDHLLRSWHRSTRPASLDLDAAVEWIRLHIVGTHAGGPFADEGTVHFVAVYRTPEGRGRQEEISRFVREGARWFYLDGELPAC